MKIVLTPEWFLGKDVLIDTVSFIVLLAFFILCWKGYKLNKKDNFLKLGISFLIISIAQLATILTKLVLYYDTTVTQQIGQVIITSHVIQSVDIFYYIGFFFHKFLTLLGLFIIYKIPDKKQKVKDIFIAIYFLFLSAVIGSRIYYVYHISVMLFILLIVYNYYQLWKKNKNNNTKILVYAFAILSIAHLSFLLSPLGGMFVLGNLLELGCYLILIYLMIRILRAGKN